MLSLTSAVYSRPASQSDRKLVQTYAHDLISLAAPNAQMPRANNSRIDNCRPFFDDIAIELIDKFTGKWINMRNSERAPRKRERKGKNTRRCIRESQIAVISCAIGITFMDFAHACIFVIKSRCQEEIQLKQTNEFGCVAIERNNKTPINYTSDSSLNPEIRINHVSLLLAVFRSLLNSDNLNFDTNRNKYVDGRMQ